MDLGSSKYDIFLNELLSGKSQRQSYYIAYPHSKKWKESSVDVEAAKLMAKPKIIQRYNELLEVHRSKCIITREELLSGLVEAYNMALGKNDMTVTLTDKGYVTQREVKMKSVDLKALKGIAETIAKMEGFIIDKVEHSGKVDTVINIIPASMK